MSGIFHTYLYSPILWVFIFIYENLAFKDIGFSIFILTVLVRVVLFPIFYKSAKDQSLMQRIQPKLKKIQTDHKDNKEEQARQMMNLYKENKLNPFSGFLLLLIQLPVFIVLFQIFTRELSTSVFDNQLFLGLINLGEKSIIIAIIAAGLQYLQSKLLLPPSSKENKDEDTMARVGKTMVVVGPVLTFFILMNLPSALGFYWVISSLFSIAQQVYINKKIPKEL
ncbi:MAG: YidC/Oxa1 family membrane protein insertase [Patescibacteria group bacterium]